tara:strand:- start:204 stop:506 length:303 start_codon:yes stop_codon:yes gene_type:complete
MSCSPEILDFLEECEKYISNIGDGLITNIINGKRYHGVNRDTSIYYTGNFTDHHFAVYPIDRSLPNKKCDTYDQNLFCSNCIFRKKNRVTSFYECLGHEL